MQHFFCAAPGMLCTSLGHSSFTVFHDYFSRHLSLQRDWIFAPWVEAQLLFLFSVLHPPWCLAQPRADSKERGRTTLVWKQCLREEWSPLCPFVHPSHQVTVHSGAISPRRVYLKHRLLSSFPPLFWCIGLSEKQKSFYKHSRWDSTQVASRTLLGSTGQIVIGMQTRLAPQKGADSSP